MMDWLNLRKRAIAKTKQAIAASVSDDNLIAQTINSMEDLDRAANLLTKRLREWYEWYCPEFSKAVSDNEAFSRLIIGKEKESLLAELKVGESMGADLPEADVQEILGLAKTIGDLYVERNKLEQYVERLMQRHCPNITAVAGATIGARLLREAGSLRRIATIQASTIQLYGAEKALFRHLKTGARSPKHGHIINHPLLAKAPAKEKGKVARALADKISIAAKVDFFKGEPIGEKLRKELEAKFS